jgi:predicted metal-dependent enzyme (double-stranded beta helix superfamily)
MDEPEPIRFGTDALSWLAQLYGSSCVVPWSERGLADPTERFCELLELSADFEVWAIHWPGHAMLQLHDHGSASGALWVVEGTLEEAIPDGRTSRRRVIGRSHGTSFTSGHLHEVSNPTSDVTTSVHVYSPPIDRMTFFTFPGQRIVPERTEFRAAAVNYGRAR